MIKIAKALVGIFILYIMWFKEAYMNVPLILYGTVLGATAAIGTCIIKENGKLPSFPFVRMLFIFGTYSFVTGMFVSKDFSWFISMMVTFFAFSIVCFDIFYISYKQNDSEWVVNCLEISAVLCAIQTIFLGADYRTEVIVRTMGLDNNPNTLGFTMVLGIFAIISRKKRVTKGLLFNVALILVFMYVIILTGSRKSLACGLLLVGMWFVFILRSEKGFTTKKILMILSGIVASCVAIYYVLNFYLDSASFARLQMATVSSGAANTRALMFMDGIRFWEKSPIVGIGFGQYQIWSSYHKYSHSSYAEILSCTGTIGTMIFFYSFISLCVNLFKSIYKRDKKYRYDYAIGFLMIVIEILMGLGQIFIYDVPHLIILTYLAMSCVFIERENDNYFGVSTIE